MWDSVKNSQRTAELQAYLTQFPEGTFATLARGRMEELKAAAPNPVRLPTVAPAPAAPSVVAKTPPEAAATVTKTSPAAPPVTAKPTPQRPSDGTIGTLLLTDTTTGSKRNLDVTVQESNAEETVYSSGDVVGTNGKVLQIRLGDAVMRVASGALWTIPLKAGTSGEAGIRRVDVDYESTGTLTWKAVAAGEGRARIEADVGYRYQQLSGLFFFSAYGKWAATYSGGSPLPESWVASVRGAQPGGANMVSAELKLR